MVKHIGPQAAEPWFAGTAAKPAQPPAQAASAQQAPVTAFPLPDQHHLAAAGQAQPALKLDEIDASTELELHLEDLNGVTQTGKGDLQGSLKGQIQIRQHVLAAQLKDMKKLGDAKFKGFSFDPKAKAYVLKLEAKTAKGLLWDNFELHVKTNAQGQLFLDLNDNWFPNSSILNRVKNALSKAINQHINQGQEQIQIELEMTRKKDKLYLSPRIQELSIPLGAEQTVKLEKLSQNLGRFEIDTQGNLNLHFDKLNFSASSDARGKQTSRQGPSDRLHLQIQGQSTQSGAHHFQVKGQIDLNIDAQDASKIAFGGVRLSDKVTQTRIEGQIDSRLEIDAQGKLKLAANNRWHLRDTVIEGKKYQIESTQLEVRLDTQKGVSLSVSSSPPPKSFQPSLSQNVVEMLIGGPAYHAEMLGAIRGARQSIAMESFLYYDEASTRDLARDLALKAAGLRQGASRLRYDPLATQGVPVHLLVNHRLTDKGFASVQKIFADTVASLKQEIDTLPIETHAKNMYKQRLDQQLHLGGLRDGVAKADHRKMLVIDGLTGYTGGINMGDHFLLEDSYHDIMLKLNGPGAREMHQHFADNWRDFTGQSGEFQIKSRAEAEKHQQAYSRSSGIAPSATDIITTDDQSTEIEAAILDVIQRAEREINLEHAYFYHPPTLAALKGALARGVKINIIVPEKSDEGLYNIINTEMIRQLMETQHSLGKGQVNAFLYTGTPGKYSHMAHTKALSVDGKYAVVGSANLIPRSLQSPFKQTLPDGSQQQVLFNEEIAVYLSDPPRVQELNQKLFEYDLSQRSKALSYQDVLKRIEALGGQKVLQKELLKAQLS